MHSVMRYFLLSLLLSGLLAPLWGQSLSKPAAQEAWYDQPQLRKETLIEYQPVSNLAALPLTRVSAAEIDAGALATNSAATWSSGGYSRSYLLGGERLIGRATVQLALPPEAASQSRTILLQIKRGSQDFETVAASQASGNDPITLTFPGQQATAVRVLVSGENPGSDPVAALQVEQIQLAAATRIMLLGDSITDGKYSDDALGYRKVLYDKLVQGGFSVDFVGGYGAAPYESHFQGGRKTYDFYPNNGIKTPQLDVTDDMNNYRPNIIGIHLGTNNLNDISPDPIGPYETPATPAGQMANLVKYLLKWHDGTNGADLQHIFVCLISPIKNADSLVAVYNIEIARVARNFANGVITGKPEPVHIVDLYTRFYENPVFNNDKATQYALYMSTPLDASNRLHPNTAGHLLMGQTLHEAIKPVLSGVPLWFTDVSWETNTAGLDAEYGSQGLAIADANSDGRMDLYTTRVVTDNAFRRDLFMQKGAGQPYTESAESWGVKDAGDSRGALFIDIDRDNDLDLINGNSPGRNRLYENLHNAAFQEITTVSGLDNSNAVTTAMLALDADGDDDLDLYAVNSRTINEFYLNQGNGHFQRADRGANDVDEPGIASESASAADFDNDGDSDIYITKRGAANKLFINNGAGYFSEGAAAAGLALNHNSKSASWADLDNDGDLDLLVAVTNTTSDPNPLLRVFKNNGSGVFQDISSAINIPMNGFSVLTGDFDQDGDLDLVTTSEAGTGAFYRNNGNWQFSLVSSTGAEVYAGDVRSGAVFDYDNDGDLDFFLTRSDIFNVFKENTQASGNHYLFVHATGPGNCASPFGTKIWCYQAGGAGDPAALLGYREIFSGTGHLAQYPLTQHFGLGSRGSCDILVQFTDNTFVLLRQVSADQTITVSPQSPAQNTGTPAQILAYAGQNQSANVGSQLPLPLTAKAVDSVGAPLAGVHVDFSVTSGDATVLLPAGSGANNLWLEAESGRTSGSAAWAYDAACSGNAQLLVPPQGRGNGRDTLSFTLATGAARSLWLRAHTSAAGATIGATMDNGSRNNQTLNTAAAWQWLRLGSAGAWSLAAGSHRLILELTPGTLQIDRILVSADPAFTPSGLGESSGSDPFATDSQGLARRQVQLGTQAGPLAFQARASADGKYVTAAFQATSKPGPAAAISMASGNNQVSTQPGTQLPAPFVVTLRDAFGNPTPGEAVLFSVRSGGGTLIPANGQTTADAAGEARATLVPGKVSGIQQVAASAASISGSEVLFSATVSGGAANLVYLQGDAQADTVHAVLALPIRFRVTREGNLPVAAYPVTVSALNGGRIATSAAVGTDSLLQILTGSDGILSVYWRLGPIGGEQSLKIEASGLAGSPRVLKATAAHALPFRILPIAGDRQTGVVATKLSVPFTARVVDRYGNAISGHAVQFRIIAGGGALNGAGQSQSSATTDISGAASVQLTLGNMAGEDISQVEAVSQNNGRALTGSPLIFYASAKAGPPAFIFALSGNQQSGVAGSILPQNLVVAVKDFYQNSVVSHPIIFSVTMGNGKVNSLTQATAATDAQGLAQVQFRLGTQAGADLNQVTAQAQGLTTEAALFHASVSADAAAKISYLSGNGQSGLVKSLLAEPFVVLVSDRYDNPVHNHPVLFRVTSGDGSFTGENPLSVNSDENGRADAYLMLGEAIGDSAHRATAESMEKNGITRLSGSPVRFNARGVPQQTGDIQRLELIAGGGQSGTVNQWLANALSVRISDTFGYPVANYPVRFRIARGNGVLGSGQDTLITLTSNSSGEAKTTWRIGTLTGDSTQAVQIICLNKASLPIQGSHMWIYAAARPGAPDLSRSTMTVDSPVAADGASESVIQAAIRDEFGNAVPNQGIVLVGSGLIAQIQPNQGYSSSQGLFEARALSAVAGTLTVQARVATSSLWLTAPKSIAFVQPAAATLDLETGDGQSAPVATRLPDPLAVKVKDSLGRSLEGISVRFALIEGSAEIMDAGAMQAAASGSAAPGAAMVTVISNAQGAAAVEVRTGTRSGKLVIAASLVDAPESQLKFHLQTLPGAATEMIYLGGNDQHGITWHRLNKPLSIQVLDAFANGVPGKMITFSTPQQGGYFSPASQRTDSTGAAAVLWYLGAAGGGQTALAAGSGLANSPIEFTASVLLNQAPQLSLADSVLISENEKWSYPVQVHDIEGDSVKITISGQPEGLLLDNAGRIAWQPLFNQAGRYALLLRAEDQYGAAAESILKLIVADVNRPPQIDPAGSLPPQQENIKMTKPDAMDFRVSALDPDNDTLNYIWYINGALRAQGKPDYRLQSELLPAGDVQVKVLVSDSKSTASLTWSLKLTSAVWLAGFRAQADPGYGIRLLWQTRLETDNLGFFVQRAESEAGPFQTISARLSPAANGDYAYLDATAVVGTLYFYRLQDLSRDGGIQYHPVVQAQLALPQEFALSANFPNPFNAQTRLTISLPKRGMLQVEVIDLLGRSVRRLHHAETKGGYLEVTWDGRDDLGVDVASGVYYCRVAVGGENGVRKMVLVR